MSDTNLSAMREIIVKTEDLTVASWSEGAEGEDIPPTQVHVVYRIEGVDGLFVMRLKSKEATDSLIDALIEHRDYVWGSK